MNCHDNHYWGEVRFRKLLSEVSDLGESVVCLKPLSFQMKLESGGGSLGESSSSGSSSPVNTHNNNINPQLQNYQLIMPSSNFSSFLPSPPSSPGNYSSLMNNSMMMTPPSNNNNNNRLPVFWNLSP
jgi:hypothetical protein